MRTDKLKKLLFILPMVLVSLLTTAQTLKEATEVFNTAGTLINEKKYDEAIPHLYRALTMCEDLEEEGKVLKEQIEALIPKAHFQFAMNLYKEKKMYETLEQLEKAQETSKKFGDRATLASVSRTIPQLYNQMGNTEYRANNFEKAISYYEKAIAIKADFPDPYLGIALSYEKQENFEKMLETLKQTIEISMRANDRNKADDALKKAKAYLLRKGDEAQKAKNFEEAISFFTQVLEFDKTDGTIFFVLAINYSEIKNWDKVIEYSKLALEVGNGSIDKAGVYYQIGVAYQSLGKKAEACEAFNNALNGSFRAAAEYKIKEELKCQ
jgi:tetratricopeptide (TPR) repeat protein